MSKPALHFTHANGIPSGSYQKFFQFLNQDFDVKAIPMIGLDPHYPVEYRWEALVDQVISDIEQQFPRQQVIGLGHSFGSLLTLMAAYKKPQLFSQVIIMDPPFVIGSKAFLFEALQKLGSKSIEKLTPAAVTVKRRDHWESIEQASQALRPNRIFKDFDEQCFADFIACGLKSDSTRNGVTLTIPKHTEAEIFRTVPAWWWRTPRKAPDMPIHVLTAKDSHFYKQGLPQGMKKTYAINYSVLEGGHMFPLEQPKQTAEFVQQLIEKQQRNNS